MIFMILFTYVVLIQSSLLVLAGLFIIIVILALTTGISPISLISRLRWIFMIVFLTVVVNIMFNAIEGEPEILFYIIPNRELLPVRRLAVYYALRIAFWILILSNCGLVFLSTTSPKDLVVGMRTLGMPYKFAYALMIGMRYIPLIQDSTTSVVIAQKARGLTASNSRSIKRAWTLVKDRLTTSLILIFKQIKITAKSLELRGFGKFKKRTDTYQIFWHYTDILFLTFFFLIVEFISFYRFGVFDFIPPIPSLYSLIWL
jgi:energy-coupling factor transport system permease protein